MNALAAYTSKLTPFRALQFFHLFRQGTAILIAVLLAKSSLPTFEIGTYEQLQFLGYSLTFFWLAGLQQSLLTFFPNLEKEKQPVFFTRSYLVYLVLSGFFFLVLIGGKKYVLQALIQQDNLPYYELFLVFLLFGIPTNLLENFYLLQRRSLFIVLFGGIGFGLQLIAVISPVFLGYPFIWSFYALIAVGLLKHGWLLYFLRCNARWRAGSWSSLFPWFQLAVPLVLYAFIGGLNGAFDNWLVNYYYEGDPVVFAVFRYGARELPLTMAMAAAFSTSMLPEVAAALQPSLARIKQKSRKLFHLLFPVAILAMLSSNWLFPLVFSAQFAESAVIFNVYLLILISRVVFPHTILIGLGENRVILLISLLELTANILLSCWFVTKWGLSGIAMGTVLAFMLEKVLMIAFLWRRHGIAPQVYLSLPVFFLYSLGLMTVFCLAQWW